jgi:hypothetical protein
MVHYLPVSPNFDRVFSFSPKRGFRAASARDRDPWSLVTFVCTARQQILTDGKRFSYRGTGADRAGLAGSHGDAREGEFLRRAGGAAGLLVGGIRRGAGSRLSVLAGVYRGRAIQTPLLRRRFSPSTRIKPFSRKPGISIQSARPRPGTTSPFIWDAWRARPIAAGTVCIVRSWRT